MDNIPELPISDELKNAWRKECFRTVAVGMRLRSEQDDFLKLLEKENIPYVILKGTAAAVYYPDPSLRGMGDVDVYIPDKFHDIVDKLLSKNGYALVKDEEDDKRHNAYKKNNIEFEIHRSFATTNGSAEKAYIDGLLDECNRDRSKSIRVVQGQTEFYMTQTNINGIVLLEHIGHHMVHGLGLRQIIDWMMFVKVNLHDEEWEEFQLMAQKAGLETLAKTVTKMCVNHFGLKGNYTWCNDADDEVSEELLAYLFDSGNFGMKIHNISQVSTVENRIKHSKNIIVALQRAGECNWKLYKRHRWLQPVAWVYQIFRYTRQIITSKDGIKTLKYGTEEANRRAALMNRLEIYKA